MQKWIAKSRKTHIADNANLFKPSEQPLSVDATDIPVWESVSKNQFDPNWLTLMETHQSSILPMRKLKRTEDYRSWLVYNFNEEDPKASTFGCRLCQDYYDSFKIIARPRSRMSIKGKGVLRNNAHANAKLINEHSDSSAHSAIVEQLKLQFRQTVSDKMLHAPIVI